MLIVGTGMPGVPIERAFPSAGPRVYPIKVKQGRDGVPNRPAYCFVGRPVSGQMLDQIRVQRHLSNNYGAVFIPMTLLAGTNADSSRGIVGIERDNYIVRGLLPTPDLRFNAMQLDHLAEEEGIVYASPEDFPGLQL